MKLLKCPKCGKVLEQLPGTHGCPTKCCGDIMVELKANTTDAAVEKHVPVVVVNGDKVHVQVGSIEHPMLEEHHIAFIYLETDKGVKRVDLSHTGKPVADFALLDDEKPLRVYEYCNLHGLWVKEL